MIRVIGGLYKGRKLKKVKDPEVRPITDRIKETLFNIIQNNIKGKIFLDGFAGTGSVGIEAFSRGAKKVVFIEYKHQAVKIIEHNLSKCGIENNYEIICKDFNLAVIRLAKEKKKFDIIFLDPPYAYIEERNPLKVIKKREILKPQGIIILRHFIKTKFDPKYFRLFRRVVIGSDVLSFYKDS